LGGCAAEGASTTRPAPPLISGSLLPSLAQLPSEQEPAVALGRFAPDFALPDFGGQSISLSQWRGQIVLLNFWASWCQPCREEMPLLQATYEAYAQDGLMVLGVNMGERARRVVGFAEDLGLTFPTLVDEDTDVGTLYRVRGAPTTYFIDREGVIRQRYVGPLTPKALGAILSGADAYPTP
jgi:cytochrome c biogenesis protein CcmG/thiol:disulfide interchange protein DsbE